MRSMLFLAATLAAGVALAQTAALTPPAERISDPAIHADYRTYEATQGRIKTLNDRGPASAPRLSDYHLAKAQCWLDVSFHEYTRNDRSPFPQQALDQSARLIALMESNATSLPNDTPLVNGADRLRLDLWDAVERMKAHPGYRCAAANVACAEVELVHAGNEHKQLGWRHAQPYVQMAEDRVADAQAALDRCVPAPVAAVPVPAPRVETVSYVSAVLFNFGGSGASNIRAMTRERLEKLMTRAQETGFAIESITVTGHADRLNASGRSDYNEKLALVRAAAVADLFVAAGIDRSKITVSGLSDRVPVEVCNAGFSNPRDLEECLAPNRRVEVDVTGRRTR